jgi:hypothetical protein
MTRVADETLDVLIIRVQPVAVDEYRQDFAFDADATDAVDLNNARRLGLWLGHDLPAFAA